MKTKVKQININKYMNDCINYVDDYSTHFNNHMSNNYKDTLRNGIIIILSIAIIAFLLF